MANKLPPARTRHDGAARDPTPEQALRESEQRFRVMANTVPLLEWIADADGSVTWCNAR